jgi:hypothetical protein
VRAAPWSAASIRSSLRDAFPLRVRRRQKASQLQTSIPFAHGDHHDRE